MLPHLSQQQEAKALAIKLTNKCKQKFAKRRVNVQEKHAPHVKTNKLAGMNLIETESADRKTHQERKQHQRQQSHRKANTKPTHQRKELKRLSRRLFSQGEFQLSSEQCLYLEKKEGQENVLHGASQQLVSRWSQRVYRNLTLFGCQQILHFFSFSGHIALIGQNLETERNFISQPKLSKQEDIRETES